MLTEAGKPIGKKVKLGLDDPPEDCSAVDEGDVGEADEREQLAPAD
jgi:hypothetical protein